MNISHNDHTRTSWNYPAVRAWALAHKLPDHRIDTLIIGARRDKAPRWAVEKRNGQWASLNGNVPADIEFFFVCNQPEMLDQAGNQFTVQQ